MEELEKRFPNTKFGNVILHAHGVLGENGGGKIKLDANTKNPLIINSIIIEQFLLNPTNDKSKKHFADEVQFKQISKEIMALNKLFENIVDKGNLIIAACEGGKKDVGSNLGKSLIRLSGNRIDIYLNQDQSYYLTFAKDTKGTYGSTTKKGFMLTDRLTDPKSLKLGWLKFSSDGEIVKIKTGKDNGNLYIGAYKKDKPFSTKPIYK